MNAMRKTKMRTKRRHRGGRPIRLIKYHGDRGPRIIKLPGGRLRQSRRSQRGGFLPLAFSVALGALTKALG